MQKLGCPESFTEPKCLYEVARLRGMSAVTITDHNLIEGAQQIAHLPNTFISCEYTAYFPEDRCKVHVLVYDITPEQHAILQEARQNIVEFVHYLNEQGIAHACAHPLYGPNDRLTALHIEKLLVLFKVWEWNGDLAVEMNQAMRAVVDHVTQEYLYQLADKHGISPYGSEPWRKCIISGSDDHSSLNLAGAYTEVRGAKDFASFWDGVLKRQARISACENSPRNLARNIYSIAYQYYKKRFNFEKYRNHDIFLLFVDRLLQYRLHQSESRLSRLQRYWPKRRKGSLPTDKMSLFQLARHEATELIQESPDFLNIVEQGLPQGTDPNQVWADFVNTLGNKLLVHLGNNLIDRITNARLFDLFHSLGSAAALYAVMAPYFVSFSHFIRQRRQADALVEALNIQHENFSTRKTKVAHFTDTFFEVNGVARTLQQHLAAAQELGKPYSVITCADRQKPYVEGLYVFDPVGTWKLQEYSELDLYVPSFLQLLQYCYEEGFTHFHVSTPGPVGLAAVGIARILQLPISGTYHTAMPQYGRILTEDSYVEELLWKGMIAFYQQLDFVYAPSQATAQELIEKGLNESKVRVYPRGVNTDRFHPDKANPSLLREYGCNKDSTMLLYVGRISKEKALDKLVASFRLLRDQGLEIQLVVVGDGPYRAEMEANLLGYPVVFTGYLEGDALPALYASADIFVFPSTTDTFGNVVLEAQASGTPVIVSDQGGPKENILPGETGLLFQADNVEALTQAISQLVNNPQMRKAFGQAGRKYIEKRSFKEAFSALYDMYVEGGSPSTTTPPEWVPLTSFTKILHTGAA